MQSAAVQHAAGQQAASRVVAAATYPALAAAPSPAATAHGARHFAHSAQQDDVTARDLAVCKSMATKFVPELKAGPKGYTLFCPTNDVRAVGRGWAGRGAAQHRRRRRGL